MATINDGIIERFVRKAVTGRQERRNGALRREAHQIALDVRSLDTRLELAEAARIQAEQQRDRAIFELERLFHFVPAYLVFKDTRGTLLRVNETAAAGFGLEPADMVGRSQRDFWPADQCDRFEQDDREILLTRTGKYGYLEPVQWNGETHTFRTWKAPLYNGHPDPIGVMLFAIDVTIVGDTSIAYTGDLKTFRQQGDGETS